MITANLALLHTQPICSRRSHLHELVPVHLLAPARLAALREQDAARRGLQQLLLEMGLRTEEAQRAVARGAS